mmetsp:Transcript_1430/g.3854  ORF Transcript_1430/g.3854 Transcript_1430/m.3854 type:complete len:350 (-) Transcript_1430:1290-2339(-)
MSPNCCPRTAVPIMSAPDSPRKPRVRLMSSSASSNCPASPKKRATSMHDREGSSPSSSLHCVAMPTPLSGLASGFCTRITFFLPPGACIFSSAHSDRDSASAAGAVLVLRSASRALSSLGPGDRYASTPLSSTTLPRNVPPAFSSSHMPPPTPCSTTLHSMTGCDRPCTATPSFWFAQTMLCVKWPPASSSSRMPAAFPSQMQLATSSGRAWRPTYTPASSELRIMLNLYTPVARSMMTRPRPAPLVSTLPSHTGLELSSTAMFAPSLWQMVLPRTVTVVLPRMMMPPSGPCEMTLPMISLAASSSSTMLPCALCDRVFWRYWPLALCRTSSPACLPSRMMLTASVGFA